eukprot:scaffold8247_cov116-Isochrysis_galbana.AAC.12
MPPSAAPAAGRAAAAGRPTPAKKASVTSHLPIHNPSYATQPEMWHAVAMQQERLASLGLPGATRRAAGGPSSRRAAGSGRDSAGARRAGMARPSAAATIREHAVAATALLTPSAAAAVAAARSAAAAASTHEYDSDGEDGAAGLGPLSLAQRMGLVEAPAAPLAPEDWDVIAERSRQIMTGAERACCTICLAPFRGDQQVLLSCSHVFHRDCLRSWERYSRSRCCPVCRKQHYKKRAHTQGARRRRGRSRRGANSGWQGPGAGVVVVALCRRCA